MRIPQPCELHTLVLFISRRSSLFLLAFWEFWSVGTYVGDGNIHLVALYLVWFLID